jgi:putative transposase
MAAIDRIYTEHPYYGKRRMSVQLRQEGLDVGKELARSLMLKMGLEASYPKPNLSIPNHKHKIYPYLLRGVKIDSVNQVWSTDITYIPVANGFFYLTAIVDWFSRYILSWRLSNSLDGLFCREALLEALERFGHPRIFNTDQGCQFTAAEFTEILLSRGIDISMDGRGRALDNIWIERFWRTLKYEDIYLKDYTNGLILQKGLSTYFPFYNEKRPHSSLQYNSPGNIYRGEIIL